MQMVQFVNIIMQMFRSNHALLKSQNTISVDINQNKSELSIFNCTVYKYYRRIQYSIHKKIRGLYETYKEQHSINEVKAIFQKIINEAWQIWKTVLKKKRQMNWHSLTI